MLLDAHTAAEQLDPAAPLAMLLHHFDVIVQTPADVDKLDAAILQLAVEGKLVAQDPNDEPATVLFKHIQKTKNALAKNGVIPKQKKQTQIDGTETPYAVPSGWIWCRWNDASMHIADVDHKMPEALDSGIPYISPKDFTAGNGIDFSSAKKISSQDFTALSRKIKPEFGDIIFPRYGTIGVNRLVEVDFDFLASYSCAIVKTMTGYVVPQYAYYYSLSPLVQKEIEKYINKTTQPNVGIRSIQDFLFPLPPLAEQKRIVARVDELRRHTAALRAELAAAAQDAVTVNNAALNRLHTAEDAEVFDAAWQTLRHAFDPLYSVPQNLTALRQTILQLAVQGKLVPQDPNDEPATELIKRIEAEKERLYKEALIGKPTKAEIVRRNVPFSVPELWLWTKFETVANIASNLTDPSSHLDFPHIAPNNIEKGTGKLLEYRTVREDDVRSSKHRFYPGQILYSKIRPNLSKVVVVDFEGLCSADMYPIDSHIDTRFQHLYMLSETFVSMATNTDTRVAMPKINQTELNKLLVPLPPLAEQERIVAKVDELLALCDLLEGELIEAEAVRVRLVDAVLAGV